jgi:hypothetical protein
MLMNLSLHANLGDRENGPTQAESAAFVDYCRPQPARRSAPSLHVRSTGDFHGGVMFGQMTVSEDDPEVNSPDSDQDAEEMSEMDEEEGDGETGGAFNHF